MIIFTALQFIAQLALDVTFVVAASFGLVYFTMGAGCYFTSSVPALRRFDNDKAAGRMLLFSIVASLIWTIGSVATSGLITAFMNTLGLFVCLVIAFGIGWLIVEDRRHNPDAT